MNTSPICKTLAYTFVFCLVANTRVFATSAPTADAPEITLSEFSSPLSQLGLTYKDLNWGPPIHRVRLAALLITPRQSQSIKLGKITLVISIQNLSQRPLIIPLVGDIPTIIGNRWDDPAGIPIFEQGIPGLSGGIPSTAELKPGKMISFHITHVIDRIDKYRVPMLFSVKFDDWGMVKLPPEENGLLLRSDKVLLP